MDEETRVSTLGIAAFVVPVASALFVFASKLIAVVVLATLLLLAMLWVAAQYRQANHLRATIRKAQLAVGSRNDTEGFSAMPDPAVLALRGRLRDDEAMVLEQIAADADTDDVLESIVRLLATQFSGSQFRIINDELFGDEVADRTWTILPRTDTDLGWVLQAMLADPEEEPSPDVISLANDLARLALDKARSQTHLRYQADHDALTGLLSRRTVLGSLDHAIVRGDSIGLVYCDIDKFKEINDTLGHQAGDDLLVGIADRLQEAAAEAPFDCMVGRLGGDEYLIVASGPTSEEMVQFVETMSFAIRVPFTFSGKTITTSLSMGAAFTEERDENEPRPLSATLLKESDLALYQVKRTGRDSFRFFDDELRQILDDQRQLQADLEKSITSRSGIHAMYQPQFDASRQLVGFEALGRWYRGGVGLVSPEEFLELASEQGLTASFDHEVFHHISQVLGTLRREGRQFGSVAINVSAERLERVDFVAATLDELRRNAIDPKTVVLEITESSLLRDLHERGKRLEELRAWGVRIAIDDFGTGYSSLSYLRELPVDIVKLDKDFVSDIDSSNESRAIVRAIMALAEALDLEVVAEGVEREEQFETLKSLGCNVFQGFLLGRALDLETARVLAEQRWSPDPFSSAFEWSDGPPADASSIEEDPSDPSTQASAKTV